jgi:hypothetical protein
MDQQATLSSLHPLSSVPAPSPKPNRHPTAAKKKSSDVNCGSWVKRSQLLFRQRQRVKRGDVRRFATGFDIEGLSDNAGDLYRVARCGEHAAEEEKVTRLNGGHVRPKRRWRIGQMNAEFGQTVLGAN